MLLTYKLCLLMLRYNFSQVSISLLNDIGISVVKCMFVKFKYVFSQV